MTLPSENDPTSCLFPSPTQQQSVMLKACHVQSCISTQDGILLYLIDLGPSITLCPLGYSLFIFFFFHFTTVLKFRMIWTLCVYAAFLAHFSFYFNVIKFVFQTLLRKCFAWWAKNLPSLILAEKPIWRVESTVKTIS